MSDSKKQTAEQKSNFLKRTITGFFFVLVLISGLMIHKAFYLLTIGLILFLCLNEYLKLIRLIRNNIPSYFGLFWGLLAWFSLLAYHFEFIPLKTVILCLLIPLFMIMVICLIDNVKDIVERPGMVLLGMVYFVFPCTLLAWMGFEKTGDGVFNFDPLITLQLFVLVWVNDTFAYLGGKLFGRNKLFPAVSPNKTIEGLISGIIFCCVSALIFQQLVFKSADIGTYQELVKFVSLGIVVGLSATIGDLFQSAIKRKSGVKDSGKLLPGHGGAWDRFDGLILAVPFYYLILF